MTNKSGLWVLNYNSSDQSIGLMSEEDIVMVMLKMGKVVARCSVHLCRFEFRADSSIGGAC